MTIEAPRTRVTAADFVRRFGCWQEQAVQRPVYVTRHGRDRMVLLSIAGYQALRERAAPAGLVDRPPLDTILEQISEGFFAVDPSFRLVDLNVVAAGYLRLVRATAIGQRLVDEIGLAEDSMLMTHLSRAVKAGEMAGFSMPSPAYAGRVLNVRVFPHGDGAACLMRDITDETGPR